MPLKNIRLYIEFYKTTLFISLPLAIITFIASHSLFILTFTFYSNIINYFYKEYYKKNDYFFYFNKNISKNQLFLFCILFNLAISLTITLLYACFTRS